MLADEMHLSTILNGITPQNAEQEKLLASLNARANGLAPIRENTRTAAQEAALSVTIKGMLDPAEGTDDSGREQLLAQMLKDNPDAAAMLIRGVLGATEGLRVAGQGDVHHVDHAAHLATEAKSILDELEASNKKLFRGLALRTTERVARAALSAATLGIGGIAYDTFKDVHASMAVRKEFRQKRKALLMSSGAFASY